MKQTHGKKYNGGGGSCTQWVDSHCCDTNVIIHFTKYVYYINKIYALTSGSVRENLDVWIKSLGKITKFGTREESHLSSTYRQIRAMLCGIGFPATTCLKGILKWGGTI